MSGKGAPPSIISIRSGSASSRQGQQSSADNDKTGLDLALATIVQVDKTRYPDGQECEEVHTRLQAAIVSPYSQRTSTKSRKESMTSGVSFALEEGDDEDNEDERSQDITSHYDLFGEPGGEDPSVHSCSVVMPDIDVEEEENEMVAESSDHVEEERTNLLEDIREALQKYAVPRQTTGSSSDYWKGLLVGLFLCQALFGPLWAMCSVTGDGSTGVFGFLYLMFRRIVVASVAGAGFVIVGVVAMEYDKVLQQELEQLTRAKAFGEGLAHTMSQAELQRQPQRPRRSARTQTDATERTAVSMEEQNLTNRSVSLTAPSTSSRSDAGTADGDNARNPEEKKDEYKEESVRKMVDEAPIAVRRRPTVAQAVVNHTPDTLLCETKDMSMSFSSHLPTTLDLSDASHVTPANFATKSTPSVARSEPQQSRAAEIYTDATVLQAHISGFSAWQSQRSPEQIFTLLEKVHQRFDEAAQRLQITKVETTSESYMAVAGVPEPQEDHALRMIKFAKTIMQSMVTIVTALEGTLGPGTMDLRLRVGISSGSVTAGALSGRFQVFGSTVGLASIMESTSHRHRIQVSDATAELVCQADKADWLQKREETVTTKDGEVEAHYVVITAPLSARSKSSLHTQKSNMSLKSMRSTMSGATLGSAIPTLPTDQSPKVPKRRQVWDDGEDNFILSLPPMSRTAKNKRLVGWVNRLLNTQLKKVVAQRGVSSTNGFEISEELLSRVCHGVIPMDEVVDVFGATKPEHVSDRSIISSETSEATLHASVASQLREIVSRLASLYRDDNPYHNFEHASNTMMAVEKLLNRCISHDDDDGDFETASRSMASRSASRQYMSGVASDALCQFAILFAALAHDCGHEGLSSRQLSILNPKLSEQYDHESVAEQNSVDLAWQTIMDPEFEELHNCLFSNEHDLRRFRQVLVNCILATDLNNAKAQSMRNRRWDRAFQPQGDGSTVQEDDVNLKATVIIECLVQAGDISHVMQHWKVYRKWDERFFREKFIAFDAGRSSCNPEETWYQEELDFFDKYAIPLARKLSECKVFGMASNECLQHALSNRKGWVQKGKQLVQEMYQRYCKRKEMEIGGFTNEEINNLTSKELDYIMKKLVEKGRNNGSNEVDAEKGQNDAAQAWLDALEIYERAPAANELPDRSIIFPIYSGLFVWIKGDKIQQDPDGFFELNLARKFVRESKLHLDPIHHTRALAMLSEVYGRQGDYHAALKEFQKLTEIYSAEAHSMAVAEVYGTDRSAHAFSFSALWHDQLGNDDKAVAACEYVIQDLLPMMDPQNTLGNFELLLNVIRVMKPRGQEKRMRRLLDEYVVKAFQKHHGPNGFTPCMGLFKPLLWLLDICADPSNFGYLEAAVEWLLVETNGIEEEFLDSIYAKACWAPHDMIAELCLRLANRLALEEGDREKQRFLVQKGLMLAWRAERKMTDMEGNVVLQVANEIHEPVFNALCEVARQMGIGCEEADQPMATRKAPLDVNLPPSYLKCPDDLLDRK